MANGDRKTTLRAAIPELTDRLGAFDPEVIVLKKIEGDVRAVVEQAGLTVPVYVLPFPGQGNQRRHVEGLTGIVERLLGDSGGGEV